MKSKLNSALNIHFLALTSVSGASVYIDNQAALPEVVYLLSQCPSFSNACLQTPPVTIPFPVRRDLADTDIDSKVIPQTNRVLTSQSPLLSFPAALRAVSDRLGPVRFSFYFLFIFSPFSERGGQVGRARMLLKYIWAYGMLAHDLAFLSRAGFIGLIP